MKQKERQELLATIANSNAKVGQIVIGDYNTVNYNEKEKVEKPSHKEVSDELVNRVITDLNGKKRALCEKQLFFGIIKVLQGKYGWSSVFSDCCRRINEFPGAESWEVTCDESNLKAPRAFRFAGHDYDEWETYEPTEGERNVFLKNRRVANIFREQIEVLKQGENASSEEQ